MTHTVHAALSISLFVALASGDVRAAPCNVHDANKTPAVGRAFRPGTTLYSVGAWPALEVGGIKLPSVSNTKNKVVVNGAFEPDLRHTWVRKSPLRFESLAPLAGCHAKKGLAVLDFNEPRPVRVPELALASWCEGDLERVRLVTPLEAWTYSQTGEPYCVALTKGAYNPRIAPKARAPAQVAPWTSSTRLWLVATLPTPAERSLDARVKLTLHENDPAMCATCTPAEDVDCDAAATFRVLERTAKLPFRGARTRAFELLEVAAVAPARATHLEVDARLFARGEELADEKREIRWAMCP